MFASDQGGLRVTFNVYCLDTNHVPDKPTYGMDPDKKTRLAPIRCLVLHRYKITPTRCQRASFRIIHVEERHSLQLYATEEALPPPWFRAPIMPPVSYAFWNLATTLPSNQTCSVSPRCNSNNKTLRSPSRSHTLYLLKQPTLQTVSRNKPTAKSTSTRPYASRIWERTWFCTSRGIM